MVPACVAQITTRRGEGGGVPLALGQIRGLMMYIWGIPGSINYNLAVNLLCVSLNTFRREIYNLQA